MGVGLEARVNRESLRLRHLRRRAIHLAALARALRDLRSYPLEIRWDGGQHRGEVLMVSVGNGRRIGGAFPVTPRASVSDGVLDLCIIDRIGRLRALALLPLLWRGRHTALAPVRMARRHSFRLPLAGAVSGAR